MFNHQEISELNPANYLAICMLEKMGLDAPTQKQIDMFEFLILALMQPQKLNFHLMETFIDNLGSSTIH